MYKQIVAATIAILVGTSAMAHGNHAQAGTVCDCVSSLQSAPLTRAQVVADLEIYRKSGLAMLDAVDSPDVYSADYQKAQQRYQALRTSPDFAMLVNRIALDRGDVVATASASSATSAH